MADPKFIGIIKRLIIGVQVKKKEAIEALRAEVYNKIVFSPPTGEKIPQGTKLGLWLFVLMINDLDISSPHLWKFVDETTASEFVLKGGASNV